MTAADAKPIIELKNLRKVYPVPGGEVVALDGISLSVQEGEIFGIIGMSGAGKSTLIRCVNRLDRPTEGEVYISGVNVMLLNKHDLIQMRRKVSMIFQHFNLMMQKNVARNVRYPLEIAGVPRQKANERVMELLEIVGLSDKAEAYPAQLSGGQKQRVAIARALASDPKVLLCDEATSALDPMTTQSILALLQDINQRLGITIVIITHEMAVIRQICGKVAILDNGSVAEIGPVDEVFTHTRSAAGRRLFGIVDNHEDDAAPDVPCLRIVFDGETAGQPIISDMVRQLAIPVNILAADIRRLRGKPYGQMIIERPKSAADEAALMEYLKKHGLTAKEVTAQ